MTSSFRFLYFLFIMIVIAVAVSGTSIWVLYNTAFEGERARLIEIAQSQARIIEAIARFDQRESYDYPGGGSAATISQLKEAHGNYKGFGQTGEFTLAKLEGDQIEFLLSHRHSNLDNPHPVPFNSQLAEPMRRALSGQSGSVIGLDYRGVVVLAAYEPVAILNLGIVSKIDLAEIRAPFIKSVGVITIIVVLVIMVVGNFLYRTIKRQLNAERQIRQQRDYLEEMVNERTAEIAAKARQLERALRKEREYSELQKKFVALVSHEFRTPLTIIDGAAQRLLRHKGSMTPDKLKERSEKIRSSVRRMIDLIDSTLYVSRFDAGKIEIRPEPCDL